MDRKVGVGREVAKDFSGTMVGHCTSHQQCSDQMQRSYFKTANSVHHLHVSVDASQRAYGAVAYLKHQDKVSFIAAKTRVAPLKKLTLPQLELMAAFLGARIALAIINALKPIEIKLTVSMLSNSQIVLYWLSSSIRNQIQFVANRVEKIERSNKTNASTWQYCRTKNNPGDLLSRGITLIQFNSSLLWFNGPTWLIN